MVELPSTFAWDLSWTQQRRVADAGSLSLARVSHRKTTDKWTRAGALQPGSRSGTAEACGYAGARVSPVPARRRTQRPLRRQRWQEGSCPPRPSRRRAFRCRCCFRSSARGDHLADCRRRRRSVHGFKHASFASHAPPYVYRWCFFLSPFD